MQDTYELLGRRINDNLTYFINKVFNTDDGKRLLEELKKEFLLDRVAVMGSNEHYPYYREGQNDLIRMFTIATEVKQ